MSSRRKLAVAIAGFIIEKRKRKRKRKVRSHWIKSWISRRETYGFCDTLMHELREDIGEYTRFLRINPIYFDELLNLVKCDIQKQNTHLREPIPSKIKLAATFKFLSSGIFSFFFTFTFYVFRTEGLQKHFFLIKKIGATFLTIASVPKQ